LEQLIDSARAGDPACQRVLVEAGRYLGGALANTAKVIAPSVVAIGGRLAQAGPLLFESVRSSVEMRSLRTTGYRVEIRQAIFGADAVLLAASLSPVTCSEKG
jgi:predicted NBD/HSP70 family sugar kinase